MFFLERLSVFFLIFTRRKKEVTGVVHVSTLKVKLQLFMISG